VEGDAVSTPWWRPTVLALVGAALGVIGARYVLVGSGWSLLPWGLAALLVGVLAGSRRLAALDGAVFGFALAFVFMAAGYDGAASLASRLPFFALLGLVGAGCAALLAVVGRLLASGRDRKG
jgi:hypothetical protein